MTPLKREFMAALKARGVDKPDGIWAIVRPLIKSFGEYKPGNRIILRWGGDKGYKYSESVYVSKEKAPLAQLVDQLVERRRNILEHEKAKAAASKQREEDNANRLRRLHTRLEQAGFKKLPSDLIVRTMTGQEVFRVRIERFDGIKLGLYLDTEVPLSELQGDFGEREVKLCLEGEQELR